MASRQQLLRLQPLPVTGSEFNSFPSYLQVPEDILQLEADTVNVLEGTVPLSSFPKAYQKKIRNFYRFSADRFRSYQNINIAKEPNTLDIL